MTTNGNGKDDESGKTCKFFRKEPLTPGKGTCRAKSPSLSVIVGPQGISQMGAWPPVQDNCWCGEYKRNEKLMQ